MLVWLVFNHPPTLLMVIPFVGITLIAIVIGLVCIYLKDTWINFLYHRRMERLLRNMTLEQVLERSPYAYGYVFQGDDGYRIWHKDAIHDFVHSDVTKKWAQMWIVEQYCEHRQDKNPFQ